MATGRAEKSSWSLQPHPTTWACSWTAGWSMDCREDDMAMGLLVHKHHCGDSTNLRPVLPTGYVPANTPEEEGRPLAERDGQCKAVHRVRV